MSGAVTERKCRWPELNPASLGFPWWLKPMAPRNDSGNERQLAEIRMPSEILQYKFPGARSRDVAPTIGRGTMH
jgi:hypothetical protein